MKKKTIIKIILDIFMTISLPLLMIQALAGEQLHEWLGIMMLIVFLIHHILNMNWHKNLLNGHYNRTRFIVTMLNFLIFICMILSAISGIMLSQYIFVFLDINFGISFARAVHMICTHWMFVLTSFHLGMHIETIKKYIELTTKKKLESVVTKRIALFISIINIYGLKVFIDIQLWQYMFHLVEFMFYDFNRITLNVYLDYGSMMIMFSTFGYLISRLLKVITLKK